MEIKTLNDLLEIAIQDEISSQKFYRDSMEKTKDGATKDFLKSLIEEEKGHERILKSIKEMEIYDGTIQVDETIIEKTRKSHSVIIPDLRPDTKIDEILEIALRRETKAFNLFYQMVEITKESELKALFNKMAEEEMVHHKKIEIKYRLKTGQMGYEG